MTGKQKCNILRRIRRDIAAANQLNYTERDCTHQGDCAGTCPYCEAQLKRLEGELAQRRSLGQRIAVMGLSMGLLTTNLTACDPFFSIEPQLQGDMMPESTGTAQTEVTDSIPGELIANETTTVAPVVEKGELVVETLMGDPVLPPPETEVTRTMGVLPAPETEPEPAIAGGIPPASALPDPEAIAP